jgi:phosphoribosylformylglycinamidine synthase
LAKVNVYVTYKQGILDPQGATVAKALTALNYKNVESVRIGKFIQLDLKEDSKDGVEKQVTEMCQRLLANPVIEDYTFEVVKE